MCEVGACKLARVHELTMIPKNIQWTKDLFALGILLVRRRGVYEVSSVERER